MSRDPRTTDRVTTSRRRREAPAPEVFIRRRPEALARVATAPTPDETTPPRVRRGDETP